MRDKAGVKIVMRGNGVILLSLLFIMSVVLIIPSAESSNAKTESAPMPTWNVGDMWNYSFSMNSGDVNGNINMSVVKLETITVNSNEYDVYNVSAHYEYSGTSLGMNVVGSIDVIDYYCRSDTSTVKEISTVNENYDYGTYIYYNRTTTTYNPPEDSNQFPIEVGESWSVTTTANISWYYEFTGYPSQSGEGDSAISYECACIKTESLCVYGTTYDTFVINRTQEGTNQTSYYSPDVCNFVKSELYNETGTLTTEMELVSYSIGATPTRSVSGTVKDKDDNPVTGATVAACYVSNNTEAGSALTNATGEYTISNLPADTYNVTASKSGYISSYQIVNLTAFSTNIDFTLNATPTTGTITGHVYISGTTTGISDANVSINATTYAITDANGEYTLSGVAPDTHTVTAIATGYASSSADVGVTAGQTSFCNFTLTLLSETGNISGTVTTDGTGLNNATVTIEGTGATAQTNATGHYTITGVPAGTYNVTASKTGYVPNTTTNIDVTAGQETQNINFILAVSAEQQRGSISGTIEDKNGNPVAGATVTAYYANNTFAATTTTNLTGGYTLSDLLPGTYTVNVSKAGFQEYSMSVTLGANQNLTSKNAELTTETGGETEGGVEGGAGIADYWWVAVLIAVIIVVVLVILKKGLPVGRRIPVPREELVREETPVREEFAPEKPVGKRFCIKCGREISKTAGFCPYCGYRFRK